MSRFIQLHALTSYPPANLNRDDLGRPKTAVMGGEPRLRISSQSLKRAWRTSDLFEEALKGHLGVRSREMGRKVFKALRGKGVSKKNAMEWSKLIADEFGSLKKMSAQKSKKSDDQEKTERADKELQQLEIEQLAHFSPEEQQSINQLVTILAERGAGPEKEELSLLRKKHTAADIALFGRMLASNPGCNTEAAAQVAHAISVHAVAVEEDFFTAVDDLNKGEDDAGAAHLGETEFAAGLFYLYLCINKTQLIENLSGDEALANRTLSALIESVATIAPTGKQNSFASRARASYLLCETGEQQPRSLSVAYLKPVKYGDMLEQAINRLTTTRDNMNQVYGDCADRCSLMNAATAEGSLKDIIRCAVEA